MKGTILGGLGNALGRGRATGAYTAFKSSLLLPLSPLLDHKGVRASLKRSIRQSRLGLVSPALVFEIKPMLRKKWQPIHSLIPMQRLLSISSWKGRMLRDFNS